MEIEYPKRFLKAVRNLPLSEQLLLSQKIEIFKNNPQDPKLKTHQLTGKLKHIHSFSLTHSKRVLFVINDSKYIFIAVGSHDQVYR
ncbi:type II toxin-antitoxin system mRNA interferase toxin, RelE/StbE family [Candidatus Collierbacteria bacterium CG10_big_fil_rev_8_21_14_0_10_43_36]|uniref:Type II toxin-antitoxin system mRNA interferase toxin, RelE/StbE family n=3 Tax=Candidatus Collieribacteriota TaxID=1752725 RepID=A0A2H0DTK8_9BACT|nr:MAG: type II toxin-antitoxin system mRNA interferase toxin, RelE/StbE family [Candidatus Collierbacteria bacterium CG22_combo_CG10-13_8_21_14_all_43_12]PIR99823.1 MAG: type II toxin-antitoxin system mRNA interferase toxin, RelE/StbE family [Candidatus Collierbacteria bacterium CG10_big_fil_rev_8_21_14_0_10_43_36]PIZ24705.1 MAG: type II toxin-antitoxin system mRNA interferase toxin, RelE/StbE family [Candidatus Collierbacteria bacterium CG_4_10_14_0_8_um_filter_43_86]PJB47185.1 MAG: type II to